MKLLIKIIVIALVFFCGFWLGQNQALAPSGGKTALEQNQEAKANLIVDSGGGDLKNFSGVALIGDKTVFGLLKAVQANSGLKIGYKDYGGDLGAMIESIGGLANDPKTGTYWQFWVNGEYAKVGASSYRLKTGDIVEWKYLNSQIK